MRTRQRFNYWAISLVLCLLFLADTYGVLRAWIGFNFPFSHNGFADPKWAVFYAQVFLVLGLNFLLVRGQYWRLDFSQFERMPKTWRKYWNRDGVRRELFHRHLHRAMQPLAIWLNSLFLVLNYIAVRYPATDWLDRVANRWSLFAVIIGVLFLSQLLKELRPPIRATGIRFT